MAFKPYVPPSTTTSGWGSPTKLEQGWSSVGTQPTATTNLPDFMRPSDYKPVQYEAPKPVETTTKPMGVGETLAYWGQKGLKGVAQTVANVADVPDQAFRLVSLGIGSIYNPIAKSLGGKELDWNKTFTQATRDAEDAIDKAVASISFKEKEKESESKFAQALAKFENFRQQSIGEYFQKEANKIGANLAPDAQRVGKATGFIGDVLESMPTTASFINPIVGSAGILAGSLRDNATAQGKSFTDAKLAKEISYAISSGSISGIVESSFGVFDEVASLLKVGQKAFPTLKDVIGTIFRAGAGEGAEELVEYPIQQFLDWRYNNADKPVSDYLTKDKLKEWGRGGLIGFVSGGLFGIGGAVKAKNTFTPAEKATIDILARDYLNKPVDKLTVDDVNRLLTVYGNIATQENPDVFESLREAEADIKGEPFVAKTSESTEMPLQSLGSDSSAETANIITPAVESVGSTVAEPTMASEQVAEPVVVKTPRFTPEERTAKIDRIKAIRNEMKAIVDKYGAGLPAKIGNQYMALGKEYAELNFEMRPKLNEAKIKSPEERMSTLDIETIKAVNADTFKNKDAYMALTESTNGVYVNADTPIDNIMNGKTPNISAVEFYNTFESTREALRKQYGDNITLYRSEGKQKAKATKNYTTTREAAQVYVETQGSNPVTSTVVPIENVIAAQVGNGNYHEIIVGKPPIQVEAKKEVPKAEPKPVKRTLQQSIDDIANTATSVDDATKQMNALLDADDSILDELGDKIKTKADFNDELHKLLREVGKNTVDKADESSGYKRWNGIINLQLLAMKRFAERLEDVPKDSRAYSFMKHMVEYMGKSVDDDAMASLESEIDEIFYEQLHNVDVVNDAQSIMNTSSTKKKNEKLEKLYNKLTMKSYTTTISGEIIEGDMTLAPHEMVALGMWARELTTSDNAEDVIKASNIIRKISNRMTASGQFTQAARALYEVLYPEMMAKRIIKEVDNQNSPIANEDLQNQVKKLLEVINRYRSDANKYAIKDVENILKDYGDFNAFADTENPAEMLKRKIEYDLKAKEPAERSELNKMISTLFQMYKETNKKDAKATNAYEAITEMVLNRERYAKVWDRAKELMLERGAYEPQLVEYINRLADPTMTKSIMNKVISQTFKEMGKSPTDLARAYFVSDGANVDEFVAILRTQVPNLDDASFKYLSDALKTRFQQQMEERRLKLIEALGKQYDASGNRIITKEKQGVKERTINQLIDASFKRALDIDSINTAWAQRMGLSAIDVDTKQQIYDTMKQIAKMEDEEQREIAFDNLLKDIAGKLSGTNYEKFLAWRRAAMLFSPVSWIKNGLSNMASLPFYKMTDKIETVLNNIAGDDISADRRISGEKLLKAGVNAEIDDAVARYSTRQRIDRMIASSSKYTIGKIISAEKRIFGNSKIEQFTKLPYHAMSTGKIDFGKVNITIPFIGDQYMFTKHFTTAMRNRLNAINYSQITNEQDRATAEKKAADEAYEVAIIRTYRKISQIAHKIQSLKNSLHLNDTVKQKLAKGDVVGARRAEKIGNMLNGVIDIAVPFVVTPVAIVEEAYKFSPINGFVSLANLAGYQIKKSQLKKAGIEITPEMSAQLSSIHHKLAQAISGTAGQFLVGVIFGMMGLLTGSPPDNEKERLEWAQQGKRAYSIYLKGFGSLSLDWMQPVSMVLGMGAELGQQMANNDYSLSGMGNAMVASVDALFKNSIVSDLQSTFGGGYNTSLTSSVGQFIVDGAFQGLPGIARRISRVFDQYERDVYTGNSFNVIKNRVLSHIPFASMTIPPKVDIWGNPIKQIKGTSYIGGLVPRTITNLLSPFIYQGADRDALTVEVSRLFESTNKSEALPVVPNDNLELTYKNKKYTETLVGNEWLDYQKLLGSKQYEYAKLVMESSKYASATDEKRVEYIRKAYLLASADAKEEYIKTKYNLP